MWTHAFEKSFHLCGDVNSTSATLNNNKAEDFPDASNGLTELTNESCHRHARMSAQVVYFPPISGAIPLLFNEIPVVTNDFPLAADRFPALADDFPALSNHFPPLANQFPGLANGFPLSTDVIPVNSGVVPGPSGNIPLQDYVIPSIFHDKSEKLARKVTREARYAW